MLSGIKIVDFTRYLPGPFGTLRLLDRGAEVIKIEEPDGEPGRFIHPIKGEHTGSLFRSQNRGKKSLALNLKDKDHHQKALDIIRESDVVIESFRPGVVKKLKLDYESILKINPTIVYCSLSSFGQKTSISQMGGHDLNFMAMSGLLAEFKDENGKPIVPNIALGDVVSGLAVSEAVLTGLVQKVRTGKGVYFDISMTEVLTSLLGYRIAMQSVGYGKPINTIENYIYETSDKRYVTINALECKFWENFCDAVQRKELITVKGTLAVNSNPAYLELVSLFKSKTFDQWLEFSRKIDCCMGPIMEISELPDCSYINERGFIERKWGLDYTSTFYTPGKSFLKNCDEPYPKILEEYY